MFPNFNFVGAGSDTTCWPRIATQTSLLCELEDCSTRSCVVVVSVVSFFSGGGGGHQLKVMCQAFVNTHTWWCASKCPKLSAFTRHSCKLQWTDETWHNARVGHLFKTRHYSKWTGHFYNIITGPAGRFSGDNSWRDVMWEFAIRACNK